MNRSNAALSRRHFLGGSLALGLGAAALTTVRGAFAEQLARTPRMTEGPFYPDKLPLDTDNDLIIINDSLTPAIGEITHLTGKILSAASEPIKDAVIEIWQCDANAVYLHTRDSGPKKAQQDKNFQGYGRFTTDSKGQYRFRTIKPVPYPGRPAPHIHYKVKKGGRELITSQIFIAGHALHSPADAIHRIRVYKKGRFTCHFGHRAGIGTYERHIHIHGFQQGKAKAFEK